MVKVILGKEKNIYKSVEMSGHANYDVHGKDIVCSAASVLGFTLVNYLTEIVKLKKEDLELNIHENEEGSYLYLKVSKFPREKVNSIQDGFKFFEIGVIGLVDSYDKYIELIYQEV